MRASPCPQRLPQQRQLAPAARHFRPVGHVQQGLATVQRLDRAQLAPMTEQLQGRYGQAPEEVLVDGGFVNHDEILAVARPGVGCTVYAPVSAPRDRTRDPYQPCPGDPAVIAAWRQRMGTEAAKTIYKERAATSECVNAIARNRGLQQFLVRGLAKVKAVLLWFALAHNMMRAVALRRAAEAAG